MSQIREGASVITQQVKALTASQPEEERMDLQKVFSDLHGHIQMHACMCAPNPTLCLLSPVADLSLEQSHRIE